MDMGEPLSDSSVQLRIVLDGPLGMQSPYRVNFVNPIRQRLDAMYELVHRQGIGVSVPWAFAKGAESTSKYTYIGRVHMEILIEVDSVTESSGFDHVSQCTYRRKRFVLEQADPVVYRYPPP